MSKALFITGTGTDVGKTYVTALIVKKLQELGLSAGYFKAAVSGNDRDKEGHLVPGDCDYVKRVSGIGQPLEEMCPYVYEHAYSPHLAARMEGNPVQFSVVKDQFEKVCSAYDYVTVEGSGGILCPLAFEVDQETLSLEDVVMKLELACIIVADAGLGTINSVGLTADYMKRKKIPVKGIIFNHFHPGNEMEEDNRTMCELLTGLKVIACVKDGDEELELDEEMLRSLYEDAACR